MRKAGYDLCKQCRLDHLGEKGWNDFAEEWSTWKEGAHLSCPSDHYSSGKNYLEISVRVYLKSCGLDASNVSLNLGANIIYMDEDVPPWCKHNFK